MSQILLVKYAYLNEKDCLQQTRHGGFKTGNRNGVSDFLQDLEALDEAIEGGLRGVR
jgi:hypothetical protein